MKGWCSENAKKTHREARMMAMNGASNLPSDPFKQKKSTADSSNIMMAIE